ncbi:hypothetical protein DQ237_07600 [Blastococcus sp. TF02-8]|uniref:hypothetical protein n=1 Tax=Blastococcus sp. TF02-8 TaxID=2250574 RepID=UPI000DEB0BED|nr:hypothetical protein [Blastococcus sp. TF02-8]RBY96501.1 hypothetical protein DQ237_07600 [Blastococcus sp. TF02-8]
MITTDYTSSVADVPAGCGSVLMQPPAAPSGATGLSWIAVQGSPRHVGALIGKRREQALAERFLASTSVPTNDLTTPLGIHSPGRPQS